MEALLGLTSFQGTCSAVCSWEWARGVGRWSCVVDWGSRCKMRADAIPRNWLFEVCWKLQPTQLPRSLLTGKPLAWPPLRLSSATGSSPIRGGSCISLQIERCTAENPAQSLAIPTSTSHATQRIPKKQAAGMPKVHQARLWGMHTVWDTSSWRQI